MRTVFLISVFVVSPQLCFAVGNLVDGPDADLIYDPATGHVTIDASDNPNHHGPLFVSFVFGTDQNNMRPENFVTSVDGSAGPFIDVGTNTYAETNQIGQATPLGINDNTPMGELALGEIFPIGIETPEALSEYLTLAEYVTDLDAGGIFDLIVLPEPTHAQTIFALLFLLAWTCHRIPNSK